MQIEQPHHAPPHSIGEFLRQYAMIVLSILTALGLDHVAVGIQNASAAHESQTRIEAELARNLADLKGAEQTNAINVEHVSALLKALTDDLQAGKPIDAPILALMKSAFAHFEIQLPSWQHSAWDSAIADGSAGHLPPTVLQHYSETYSAAAGATNAWQLLLGGEWLTQVSELNLDYKLNTLNERRLANSLMRFLFAGQQIEDSQKALEAIIASGKT